MFSVTITETISYAHRLQNHPGRCRTIHGHNGKVVTTLSAAELDGNGMVVDFGVVKDIIKKLDHQTILEANDPLVPLIRQVHTVITLETPPTAECLANLIALRLLELPHIESVEVMFYETEDSCAVCHEMKKLVPSMREVSIVSRIYS